MAITAAEQTFFNNAINTVFRDDKDDLTYARKLLNQNSDNIPALLTALNKLCGCSFSDKAGLQNSPPPQAVADSISTAVTESGGTPSDAVALKRKVGNAELTTTAKDLSGAVNELDEEIGSATLTTEATTVKGAINEVDAAADAAQSTANTAQSTANTAQSTANTAQSTANTAQSTANTGATNAATAQAAVDAVEVILGSSSMASVSSASNTATGIIGNSALITTSQTLSGAINEVLSAGGSSADVYTPIGTLGSSYSCTSLSDTSPTLIATGKNTIAEMFVEAQKCIIWATAYSGNCGWGSGGGAKLSYSPTGGCFSPASCDDGSGPAYVHCMYGLDH